MTVRSPGPERLLTSARASVAPLEGAGLQCMFECDLIRFGFLFLFFPPSEFGLPSRVRLGLGREGALCSLFVTLKRRALAVSSLAFLGEI